MPLLPRGQPDGRYRPIADIRSAVRAVALGPVIRRLVSRTQERVGPGPCGREVTFANEPCVPVERFAGAGIECRRPRHNPLGRFGPSETFAASERRSRRGGLPTWRLRVETCPYSRS